MDMTGYLPLYGCTARELDERIRGEVLSEAAHRERISIEEAP